MNVNNSLATFAKQLQVFSLSVYLYLLVAFLVGISFTIWDLYLNFYILEMGFNRDFLGLVHSTASLAILLFGLPMGVLIDRVGRKPATLLGLLLAASAATALLLSDSRVAILGFSFLMGLGGGFFFISQRPMLALLTDTENRNMLFSLAFGLATFAGVIGNYLGGFFPTWLEQGVGISIGTSESYQWALLLSMGLLFAAILPALLIDPPERQDAKKKNAPRTTKIRSVLRKPILWKLALPNLIIGLGAALLVPYFNLFFVERFQVDLKTLGSLFAFSALVTALGSLLAPRLARKFNGRIRAVVILQASSLVFLLLLGFSPILNLAVIGFIVRGSLMQMGTPLFESFSMDQVPENEQGTLSSVQELAWVFGWTVGPYISSLVQQTYGFAPLFIATTILYALAGVVTWIMFHTPETLPTQKPLPTLHHLE